MKSTGNELWQSEKEALLLELEELRCEKAQWLSEKAFQETGGFGQLFDQMNAAAALHRMVFDQHGNPSDYVFLRVNKLFESSTGLQASKILGKPVTEIIPGIEKSWIERYGEMVKNETYAEFEDYSKDLDRFYSVRAYSTGKNLFIVTFVDITEQRKAEIASQEEDRRLVDIIEGLNGVVYRCKNDEFWTMTFLSGGLTALTGYDPDEIIDNRVISFVNIIHPEDIEMVADVVGIALANNQRYRLEYRIITKNGKEKWVFEQGKGIRDTSNELSYLEGYMIDITDRKTMEIDIIEKNREIAIQNEEYLSMNEELNSTIEQIQQINTELLEAKSKAEESDRLKSAFLANMSHEIRTPMNSIIGFSTLMSEREIGRAKREYFSRMVSSAGEQLLRIIDDILDIAKIESNQLKVDLSKHNLKALLQKIHLFHLQGKLLSERSHLNLILRSDNFEENLIIETDSIRFMQIFGNLISNAIKNTKNGFIEFGLDQIDIDNQRLIFFVRDTGVGIPKEQQSKIFERFIQLSKQENTRGTGLGLSITQGIIRLMKGDIWLESEEGKGSVFYFSIPYLPQTEEDELFDSHRRSFCIPELEGRLVYVAEDDFPSYLYLREILDITNARIKRAENGAKLLELVQTELPDLVLVDINMPILSGIDAVKQLRTMNYSFPIIAQTAYALLEERESCLKAGCSAYISKPIDANLLFELINQSLSN